MSRAGLLIQKMSVHFLQGGGDGGGGDGDGGGGWQWWWWLDGWWMGGGGWVLHDPGGTQLTCKPTVSDLAYASARGSAHSLCSGVLAAPPSKQSRDQQHKW